MMTPTVQALHNLDGSGTNSELYDEVVKILALTEEQLQKPHKGGNQSQVYYRLGWVKTWLKHYGLLENPSRGLWTLTEKGQATTEVDIVDMQKTVDAKLAAEKASRDVGISEDNSDTYNLPSIEENENQAIGWRSEINEVLLQMNPSAFERLCQRILRESGFTQVDVSGRSGDGGIDGVGILRLGGFLSIRVLFQCKRYKGSIGAGIVRDFRGAMVGRTDKGLIVTTGNFTQAAKREATRDGAPEIDLVDGEQLIDKLKELSLGVETEEVVVERVTVNPDFFDSI